MPEIEITVTAVEAALQRLLDREAAMAQRLSAVAQRLDRVALRQDATNGRIAGVIEGVQTFMQHLDRRFDRIEHALDPS